MGWPVMPAKPARYHQQTQPGHEAPHVRRSTVTAPSRCGSAPSPGSINRHCLGLHIGVIYPQAALGSPRRDQGWRWRGGQRFGTGGAGAVSDWRSGVVGRLLGRPRRCALTGFPATGRLAHTPGRPPGPSGRGTRSPEVPSGGQQRQALGHWRGADIPISVSAAVLHCAAMPPVRRSLLAAAPSSALRRLAACAQVAGIAVKVCAGDPTPQFAATAPLPGEH